MKINPSVDLVKGRTTETPSPTGGQSGPGPGKSTAPVSDPATVHLSERSSQLQSLASSLAVSGEFDSAKVEAIKQAIRDGKLGVDAEVVADKMLTSLRDLLVKDSRG